jgi:hypothetical protein
MRRPNCPAGTPLPRALALGLLTTFFASLLDGFTLVILIPLLAPFGTSGQLNRLLPARELRHQAHRPAGGGRSPGHAAGRLVVLLAVGLLIKNALTASSQISVGAESLVRIFAPASSITC